MRFFGPLTLALAASASPVQQEQRASGPSVTIKNGTVVGSSSLGVDSFKGIPFAQPPLGALRLKPPQTLNKTFGTLQTTQYAPSCIQTMSQMNNNSLPAAAEAALLNSPFLSSMSGSEDCLYLNVQRPTGTTSGSKLPVVVWIYGGGFAFGGTSSYDASRIITRSMELNAPILYVSMAYRLNGYGFMPGKEVQKDGSTNLGLRDQRKAMEWVAENVAAFGGDPDKVVLWGESAGAISVFDQFIINGGNNEFKGHKLFRGGVMNSGSVVPSRDINSPKAQAVYDTVVAAAGCGSPADSLACLRSLPTEQFTAAVESVPGIFDYQSVDLSYLPRPDPTDIFFPVSPEEANFTTKQVPIIIGDQEDEGTLFSLMQTNLTTSQDTLNYIASYFPGADMTAITNLVNAYPDVPSAGSPFESGDLNSIYPEYKRVAAILGDITFNLVRRGYLANVSDYAPTWSYLNTYLHDLPVLGTFHAADTVVLYGPIPTTFQNPILPIDYYISFFNHLDPNALSSMANNSTAKAVYWPQWRNNTRHMLDFARFNTSVITDDYRTPQYNALLAGAGKLRI